ncbi:MAG: TonB-dependent receptor [Xanthomonadaceae bacterium]|jgi:outer membrane receptor protein involved in Fe transport|nr:TonB-dependent receptor [Xanthomonadaceae bacterium]
MSARNSVPKFSRLSTALLAILIVPAAGVALAQENTTDLDRVVVTGSLIPQTQIENFKPVMVISAEDIQMRGFTSVADVLQQSTMTTGGLQGGQTSASFTQGAEASGMFGLDPGYTKYLINGRPMANYPALYNGSDTFNNISGIPIDIVERIEILPGGQSSLYGSDAIAGVINIILKDRMDGGSIAVRGGTYTEGGGNSIRLSIAHGFSGFDDRLNVLVNAQWESRNPIWGYQRSLTRTANVHGYTDPVASRNFLVYDPTLSSTNPDYYVFLDPNNCANVADQFDGTTSMYSRTEYNAAYCGSLKSAGYRTILNKKDSGQLYTHATFDVSDNFQLYGDLLYSNESVKYATGSSYTWWGTSAKYGAFYDQNLGQFLNLQRAFAPEDIGGNGYRDIMNTDRNKSYMVAIGGKGSFGANWDYDVSFTRTEYKLTERGWARWASAVDDYFVNNVLGPELGLDPVYGEYPVFAPDYAAFYTGITPEEFAKFSGFTTTESKTWDNMLRGQLTNGSLFSLPGGDAGVAFVLEGGSQGWDYSPDRRLVEDPVTLESEVWGTTAVSGAGHRSRYAATAELRMPFLDQLTVTASARYDAFRVDGSTIDKPTYSLGVEFRPIESLLFRGKYGTAFRAPSLSDVYQGLSGYYTGVTDYYQCGQAGYTPGNTGTRCRVTAFGQQSGNSDLEPITADVWNLGVVWAPLPNLSVSLDYYSWKIEDEVKQLSTNSLMLAEYNCRNGLANYTPVSCGNALAWVTRDAAGNVDRLYTPKMNIAQQRLEAITASVNYVWDIGRFGSLAFNGNYTNKLKHTVLPEEDLAEIDLLRDPYNMWVYDAYAKTRADLSVAWAIDRFTTTAYANYIGSTPNYVAYYNGYGVINDHGVRGSKWGPYTTYNLSFNYRALDNLQLSLLVNNVLNKMPDSQAHNFPGNETEPFNSMLYNPYGRAIYAEIRYNFGGSK